MYDSVGVGIPDPRVHGGRRWGTGRTSGCRDNAARVPGLALRLYKEMLLYTDCNDKNNTATCWMNLEYTFIVS